MRHGRAVYFMGPKPWWRHDTCALVSKALNHNCFVKSLEGSAFSCIRSATVWHIVLKFQEYWKPMQLQAYFFRPSLKKTFFFFIWSLQLIGNTEVENPKGAEVVREAVRKLKVIP